MAMDWFGLIIFLNQTKKSLKIGQILFYFHPSALDDWTNEQKLEKKERDFCLDNFFLKKGSSLFWDPFKKKIRND